MERKSIRDESFQKAADDIPGNGNRNNDAMNKRLSPEDKNLPSPSSLSASNDQQQGEINLESDVDKSTSKMEEMNKCNEVIPFDQVTKELEILNTEGCTRLYTGPYGRIQSPFKKFSSFRGSPRGVKRSPRKLPIPRSKKAKLLSKFDLLAGDSSSESDSDSSTSEAETPEKLVDNNAIVAGPSNKPQPFPEVTDDESEDSDSEEDKWQIMEESDTEFDKQLDSKSDKYSLSAINVKSIIHKIVTNEKVVEMVRKAVLEQVEEKRLEYEPKMTRSKAKEVMETQGDIPHPLGLTPMKKNPHDESKFLDIDLPEDEEDDEDFNPDKVEDIQVSEDDSESFISSGLSDCETYSLPSTPTTPTSQQAFNMKGPKTPTNLDTDNSNSFLSPMGPPLQSFVPRSQHKSSGLGQKFRDAIEKDERAKREEEELIASRTRSKCPLNEVSMLDIEANFVAPDITEDMYDTTCNDQDWNHFLKTLIGFDSNTTEDTNEAGGEEEDPEFNFLEESEQDEYDQEDFRNDRAVKVSKKELNLLIDELYEAYNESDPIDINSKNMIRARTETIVEANNIKRKSEIPESLIMEVSDSERRQISDQMRQHVQLLAQSYVLGKGDPEEHQNVIDAAKMFLNELKGFSERMEKLYPDTLYKTCSLPAAMSVINDSIWTDKVDLSHEESERLNKLTFKYENQKVPNLNYKQIKALWTNPVFMYPELLPHGGFYKLNELKKDRTRVKFIEAEDNLLAMGMDQFSHLHNSKDYIHSFMLPCKTKKQIQIRIKNLSAKTAKSNAVKYWKEHKRLPVFPQSAPFFNPCLMKASQDRNISLLEYPPWAVFFRPQDAGELTIDGGDTRQRRKQRSISFTADKSILSMSGESPTGPATPVQHTDNLMSSSSSGNSTNSRAEPKRTKHLTRKKLDLDQGRTHTVPAFIPLTFSGTIKSAPSGLTVSAHMDKNPVPNVTGFTSAGVTTVDSSVISVADITASTVSSISSPLILLHNKGTVQSESVRITSNVGLSPSIAGTGIISKDGKIFVMTGQSVNVNNSAPGSNSCVNIASLNGDNVNNNMESDLSRVQTQPNACSSSVNSSFTSIPVLTSTIPSISVTYMSMSNANNNALQTAPTLSSHTSPVCTQSPASHCTELANTPDRSSNSSTQTRSTMTSPGSEGGTTPKNALEIIASYAPYLLSPSANRNQQRLMETTPKKKSGFIKLAPKPTPPGFNPSPAVPIHLPKVKSSPRRQRLNEQAKAILPKGFVLRSFDVSPSKKAASSLIEKAKKPGRKCKSQSFYFSSSSGYCKILPHPDSISENNDQTWDTTKGDKQTEFHTSVTSANNSDINSKAAANNPDNNKDGEDSYIKDRSERDVIDMDMDDDEDKGVDTESDYTQSEDGNETQEDVDSQEEIDSQEDDDNHIANLMHASTTTRFDPSKDDSCKHLGKKDRDRDTTLAMLAPDVITSDPQRDMRDTAYAQAYLHKVKKVLRDDMDILEQFLHLMFNFSKAKESPVKLYMELRSLFKDYPGLIHDFAGFLLQEQAVECECYGAFEEFNLARSFLRKLELYFGKTPHHFQKIIKTFSRWYRKPGRSSKDIKNEIEPMLKSHKYLLEEFSKFFPEDQPPDSLLDDFEEINLEGSDEEINNDSFEEIELFEGEEVLGTKRCTCTCHEWRDETFRKKKKHCYRCCLTVIDGELVYRVNKSTIKKISITLGPPFKASSLLGMDTEDDHTTDMNQDTVMKSIEIDTEVENDPDTGEELMQVDREPSDLDSGCVVDSDCLEKETFTDGNVAGIQDWQNMKSTGCATSCETDRMKENDKELDSVPTKIGEEKDIQSDPVYKQPEIEVQHKFGKYLDVTAASSILSVVPTIQHSAFSRVSSLQKSENVLVSENIKSSSNSLSVDDPEISGYVTGSIDTVQGDLSHVNEKLGDKNESEHSIQRNASDISNPSSQTALANDILAAAFNAALMSEVSLDAAFQFPLATQYSQCKQAKASSTSSQEGPIDHRSGNSSSSVKCDEMDISKGSPTKMKNTTNAQSSQVHPSGHGMLHVSSNSSFTKVVVSTTYEETSSKSDQNMSTAAVDLVQPFSPFSPFGLEIQSITNAKSPSPYPAPTVSKHRRITPIPVKGSSGDDQSFLNVVQNSPVITDMIQSPFGLLVVEKSNGDSNSSNIGKVSTEGSHLSAAMPFSDFGSASAKSAESTSHKSGDTEISSKKSNSTEKPSSSDNTGENPTYSALKISQPVLFSEDANVAFTRTSELTNMTANISEESLLQCLARPSHFCDTMGSVSNLTNILNALDEKSIHFKGLEKKVANEKHDFVDGLKNINSIGFPLNAVKQARTDTVIESDTHSVVAKSDISDQDNKDMPPGTMLGGSDSSDSGKKCDRQYYPQSILSIENLDRINTGLFRVSSLSDSESSGVPTPSNSLTQVQVVTHRDFKQSSQTRTIEVHSKQTLSDCDSVNVSLKTQGQGFGICSSKLSQIPDNIQCGHQDKTGTQESETCVERCGKFTVKGIPAENSNTVCEVIEKQLPDQNEIVTAVQVFREGVTSITAQKDDTSQVKILEDESVRHEKARKKKKKKREHGDTDSSKKKKKKRTKEKKLDEIMLVSPDVSSQDSVSGTEQASAVHIKDLTSSKAISVEETDKLSGSDCSPVDSISAQSPGMMSEQPGPSPSEASPSQGSIQSPAKSSCSSSGVVDDELNWTKETDRIILEKCKSHGIKEKTFVKIAKQLGDVTYKQVKKRFNHLYQLIFGAQFKPDGGQETSSS